MQKYWMEWQNDEKIANWADLNGGEISVPFVHEQLVGIEFPASPPRRPETMIFCYQNGSDLLWEKIVLVIEKKLFKFEAEGREFAKFLRSLEQFIQTVKGQNSFW